MHARDRVEQGTQDRERKPAGPATSRPVMDVAGVLEMQRSVGNAAVARLLAPRASPAGPGVSRLMTGNPQDFPATATSGGTTHAAPGIADARNHAAAAGPGGESLAEGIAVLPKATATAPFIGDAPTEADLYETGPVPNSSEADAAPMSSAFQVINERHGTLAAPVIEEVADPSLYIAGAPTADDVQQGSIGDCWDLASFIAIVNRDPGKIQSIMAGDGSGGASVTFQKRTETAPGWLAAAVGAGPTVSYSPEQVQVSNQLAFDVPLGSPPASVLPGGTNFSTRRLHGAALRAAPTPKERKWWVVVNGNVLEVHRLDLYEMARWAPLMEKAGARFSELYGQYGHSGKGPAGAAGENTTPRGYENLEGGLPRYTMTMFYGQAGELVEGGQSDDSVTAWNPATAGTSAILSANSAAFDRLLTLVGHGGSHSSGDTTAPVVTARGPGGSFGENLYVTRLAAAIPAAQADADWANVNAATQGRITAVANAITTWQAAPPDPTPLPPGGPPAGGKSATRSAMIAAAQLAANPTQNPTLVDNARSGPVKAMLDMLLVVKEFGTDSSSGARSVYSGHRYAVLAFNLAYSSPPPMPIQAAPAFMRRAFYGFVDVNASTVRVMNPHHTNVPDATGAVRDDTGVFEVSLDRFFRLFGGVGSAEFQLPPGS